MAIPAVLEPRLAIRRGQMALSACHRCDCHSNSLSTTRSRAKGQMRALVRAAQVVHAVGPLGP
jgi:hypothetical protein